MITLHMTTMKGEFMRLIKLLGLLAVCLIGLPVAAQTRDEGLWQRALQIHRRAIVIDTHNDVTTPMTNDDYDLSGTPHVGHDRLCLSSCRTPSARSDVRDFSRRYPSCQATRQDCCVDGNRRRERADR